MVGSQPLAFEAWCAWRARRFRMPGPHVISISLTAVRQPFFLVPLRSAFRIEAARYRLALPTRLFLREENCHDSLCDAPWC